MYNIRKQIDETLMTEVLGWKKVYGSDIYIFMLNDDDNIYETTKGIQINANDFNPSTDIKDAYVIAEKLGIAVIPQSTEIGYSWYACDLDLVRHKGDSIELAIKDDSGVSADTAPMAICLSALWSIGVEVEVE